MHPSTSLTVWMPSTALEVDLGTVRVDVWDLPVADVLPERIGVPWEVTSQSPVSIFFECKKLVVTSGDGYVILPFELNLGQCENRKTIIECSTGPSL